MGFQTIFEFTLPKGYVDKKGNLHKKGKMRLATALDEIAPLRDPRVQQNQNYLTIIILSKVIIELGDLEKIDISIIENLFTADLGYLQELYNRINQYADAKINFKCPHCEKDIEVDMNFLGENINW